MCGLSFVALGLLWGCQNATTKLPPTDCALGKGGDCGSNLGPGVGATAGTGGAGGATGTGGSTGVADISGTVAVLDSNTFDHLSEYPKKAHIIAPGPGGTVEGEYGGTGLPFGLTGVSTGIQWLLAQDESAGSSGILSTYSAHKLSNGASLVLPVVDQQVLQSIIFSQPNSPNLSGLASQIILLVRRQGSPASGVTLTSSAFGGIVAYDVSAGVYSSVGAKKTGGSGVILMLNVGAASGGGELQILLTDDANETFALTVPVAAGTATIAEADL